MIIILLIIFAILVSCSGNAVLPDRQPHEENSAPSASQPEKIESIVEPIEILEESGMSEDMPPPVESVQEKPRQEPDAPYTQGERILNEYQADDEVADEPVFNDENSESTGEILNAVSPDLTLDAEKIELELFRLINDERQKAGVESLGIEESMQFAARIRADETIGNFSHTRPDNTPYNTAFDEAGFVYAGKWHGENLAALHFTIGEFSEQTAAFEMFSELKSSPGHYRNMLNENYLQAGIGVSVKYIDGMVEISSAQLYSSM